MRCARLRLRCALTWPRFAVAFAATIIFSLLLYPLATRTSWWEYKGPALVAQATLAKEPIGDEKSVRAANVHAEAAAAAAPAPALL